MHARHTYTQYTFDRQINPLISRHVQMCGCRLIIIHKHAIRTYAISRRQSFRSVCFLNRIRSQPHEIFVSSVMLLNLSHNHLYTQAARESDAYDEIRKWRPNREIKISTLKIILYLPKWRKNDEDGKKCFNIFRNGFDLVKTLTVTIVGLLFFYFFFLWFWIFFCSFSWYILIGSQRSLHIPPIFSNSLPKPKKQKIVHVCL